MQYDNIPLELRNLRQWVCWKLEQPEGRSKPTKVPITTTGGHASTTNPASWSTFDEALAFASKKNLSGVGFVFTKDDPYVGMDFDGMPWADVEPMVRGVLPAYVEVSQSGKGIHVIFKGKMPPGARRKGPIECYEDGRYFAITGKLPEGVSPVDGLEDRTPALTEWHGKYLGKFLEPGNTAIYHPAKGEAVKLLPEDEKLLKKMRGMRGVAKRLHRLFYVGETVEAKQSEGDYDLACLFCRATADDDQVKRLMWASAMRRAKWDQHRTLVDITVRNARDEVSAPGAPMEEQHAKARLRKFTAIEEEKVNWLWQGVIPYGKMTLLIGDPGHGKSFITVDLAAKISSGQDLPDGAPTVPSNSLLVFYEDGAGDTVKPRLRVAGAEMENIGEFTMVFEDGSDRLTNLDLDIIELETAIVEGHYRLLIFDPLSAYLGDKTNAWKDDEVRRLLSKVGKMAERTRCAVVAIMHLNKKQTSNVLQRATGAGAFVAVARSVWMVGVYPEDVKAKPGEQRKLFAPAKMNLAKVKGGWVYRIVDKDGVGQVEWGEQTEYTALDMVAAEMTGIPNDGKLEQAIAFLKAELAHESKEAAWLIDAAKQNYGISERTVREAKKLLDIVSDQHAEDGRQFHKWRLPGSMVQQPPPPQPPPEATDDGDLPAYMRTDGFKSE